MIPLREDKSVLGYESLRSCSNISHFVTTRQGGCGAGAYGTFNCSPYCGDEPSVVARNQQRLIATLPYHPRELIIPRQTHGTEVRLIDESFLNAPAETRREMLTGVDALITQLPGCCLCVTTADCIPLLLYDTKRKAVAAIHAGWRGTLNRLVAHTLRQMRQQFGTEGADLLACVGPGISLNSFEVGDEVYEAFCNEGFDPALIARHNRQTDKYHLDLWEANRLQLIDFGTPATQIELAEICTYLHHEQFFSARRLGIQSGRILSGIQIHA